MLAFEPSLTLNHEMFTFGSQGFESAPKNKYYFRVYGIDKSDSIYLKVKV